VNITAGKRGARWTRSGGLFLGPGAWLLLKLLPPPADLSTAAWATAGVACWMAIWWASEAVPLGATALLPLLLLPLLGVTDISAAAAPFANPLIFLFLGGFFIALTMQRWNLHRRIALHVILRVGTRPHRLVAGSMLATALLSMWISNTATAMMMLPIAVSLATLAGRPAAGEADSEQRNFATALMLGIAYGASIGGLGTLIGSPPNALLASFMNQTYGTTVSFAGWMAIGLPVAIVLLPLCWLMLVRVAFPFRDRTLPEGKAAIARSLQEMGAMAPPERRVAAVFVLVAAAWILNPALAAWLSREPVSDTTIAIAGAVLLFVLPADWGRREFLLNWEWARQAPWEVLLLFGGGLSLARAIDQSGLAAWLGANLGGLAELPPLVLVGATVLLVIFLTEITSNTATTVAFLPVVGALASSLALDPMLLTAPAALAASCAFMLPVATPPNAIVYASGQVSVARMVRAGLLMNLVGLAVITTAAWLLF
jgi:solute carrier family 13 (sodium-dependent dicarboxylate transporter), member 2/3/5